MAFTTKVALDTNILLAVNEQKVDIFRQINECFGHVDFIVPLQVVQELSRLEKTGMKNRKNVLVAKELMRKNKTRKVVVAAKDADEALLKLSGRAIIASNDRELKKAVEKNHGRIIFLRQKKFVDVS